MLSFLKYIMPEPTFRELIMWYLVGGLMYKKLLKEDGYALLKEDGGALLLEIPYTVRSFKKIPGFTDKFVGRDMKDFTGRNIR